MDKKIYGICPIHNQESYFIYQGSRDVRYKRIEDIYLCMRCKEMITYDDILKKNDNIIRTDNNPIQPDKTNADLSDIINLVEKKGVWGK